MSRATPSSPTPAGVAATSRGCCARRRWWTSTAGRGSTASRSGLPTFSTVFVSGCRREATHERTELLAALLWQRRRPHLRARRLRERAGSLVRRLWRPLRADGRAAHAGGRTAAAGADRVCVGHPLLHPVPPF